MLIKTIYDPVIQCINYRNMVADKVTMAARLEGIAGDPFKEIFISNVLRSEVNPNYHTA